ncbi:MAG: saccharopine dehydrogenase, partial [Candidatus Atribacteria bacterium]|nr:saccharopine dehydrogenase [Candidatus Atribacteria bacterium]
KTKKWINSDKIVLHIIDVNNHKETMKLMEKYDVGAIALPNRKCSYKVVDMAIEAGLNIVDILEEYHRRPDAYETEGLEIPDGMTLNEYGESLHQKAIKNGVTFVDGAGFAPGLTNITLGEGIKKMDKAESAIARCGGIPAKEFSYKHPLKYMITWAFEHVLREYMIKVDVIKNGKIVEANAMDDLEKFRFNQLGKDEELACAITPGMPSFLYTRPQLKECAEKTIRWPGHWEGAKVLKECGMLDSTPVEFKGMKISPREFLSFMMSPKLRPLESETDVCVMWNTVIGIKDGQKMRIDYYMWEEADTENGISAMGRVTAFPEAIATVMVGKGEINQKGIVAPEDAIEGKVYQNFLEELKRRKINILEVSKKI